MALRNYRTWDTSGNTEYIPRQYWTPPLPVPEESKYWKYSTHHQYHPYMWSPRRLEDDEIHSGPRAGFYGCKFDFITGRFSNDNRFTSLRDSEEPTYWEELTDLYLNSNKLQKDYREVLERCHGIRAVIGIRGAVTMGYLRSARSVRMQYLK